MTQAACSLWIWSNLDISHRQTGAVSGMKEIEDRLKMSDGFGLFYRRWTDGVREPSRTVICLHGIESHSGAFRILGEALAQNGSEVYAFDRRGFGNSKEQDLPRGDTRAFARQMHDVNEFVEGVRKNHPGKKTFIFGHSIGCAYALWYASRNAALLDGIVLAAPPIEVGFKIPARDAIRFPFAQLVRPHSMYDLLDKWPQAFKESEEFTLLTGDELCTTRFGIRWLLKLQTKLANKMLKNASTIGKPTLIIQGDMDIIALPGGAKSLMDRLVTKDKTLRVFEGADHWFYHAIIPKMSGKYGPEQRAKVSSTVKEWLNSH